MDPRLDQLIVYSSLLENLLQQKRHCEEERDIELVRLERFKEEGAHERRINVQMQVVKQIKRTLPAIVFKMRNECDRFEQFLRNEKTIETLNESLYKKCWQLLVLCRDSLLQG